MPRRKIDFASGNYYHLYNRGANRMSIFRNDANYRFALKLMQEYRTECSVTIIAYCLMPNHYHWLLRQESDAPAGIFAQRVLST
ncbi:MAG: transposase [Anaerolineales bacterium]|nr:transposase [Anaerolineales bacterium]